MNLRLKVTVDVLLWRLCAEALHSIQPCKKI